MSAKLVEFLAAAQVDANGDPLSGYLVVAYDAGTSTEAAVWYDRAQTTPSANGTTRFNLGTDGTIEVYADSLNDYKIFEADADPSTDTPVKTIYAVDVFLPDGEVLFAKTLDALQGLDVSSLSDGAGVFMVYRAALGDGGGGLFYWDSADLSTEVTADTESGIYVAPDSDDTGASGAWVRLYSGYIDIRWFGASTGAADNSGAIQAAIDYANGLGGATVFVPTGTFVVTSGLTLYGGSTLRGDGYQYKAETDTAITGAILKAGAAMDALVTTENVSTLGGAKIVDLALNGDNVATSVVERTGTGDVIENCHIIRGGTNGVYDNGTNATTFRMVSTRIVMDETGTGLYVAAGSDNKYNNIEISGAYTSARIESSGHQFTDFHFYPYPLAVDDANIVALLHINGAGDNYFVNGHLDNAGADGSYQLLISTTADADCVENVFTNVSFDNPSATVDDQAVSIRFDASLGGSKYIAARFANIYVSGNGTYRQKYAFEKEATGAARIQYQVLGGSFNNVNELWSHAPNSYVDIVTLESGIITTGSKSYLPGPQLIGAASELTIASGAVTVTGSYHFIDTEGDAASDDLDTISGGVDGQIVYLSAINSDRTVVLKDAVDNLALNGDMTLDHIRDRIVLVYNGSVWCELSRSDNST